MSNYPEKETFVIVKDKNGNEYPDHQWNGMCWYEYIRCKDGLDGYRSDVEVVSWRYQED